MVYTEIQNVNVTGLDSILVYVITEIPIVGVAILISVWLMFTLSIYYGTRKFSSGQGDFFAAMAAGGFITCIIGTIGTFTFGITDKYTLSIILIILVISFLLLIPKRSRD